MSSLRFRPGGLAAWVEALNGEGDPYPGVTVYDTFAGVDAAALTAHTPDKAPAGAAWAHANGAFQLTSNRAAFASVGSPAFALTAIESGKADCVVSGIVQRNHAGYAALAVRVIDKENYILLSINAANQFQAIRRFANAASILATVAVTISVNTDYAIEVTLSGTSIVATLDGGNTINTSYANLTAATKHGLYAEGAAQFDNFQVV